MNDTYGHLVGSRLLAEVGAIVQSNIRKTDKAARYGGDEFVIILPHTEKAGAQILAVKLQVALQEQMFFSDSGERLTVTGSFGVASYPDDALSSSELINMADEAMYQVKASGRNGVRVAGCGDTAARQS